MTFEICDFLWKSFCEKTPEWISAIAALISTTGLGFVWWQLRLTKNIAQLQFEDSLAKEYRDLVSRIPTKALLGYGLSPIEYAAAFDELFRYIDLSNEQVGLRASDRIGAKVWKSWSDGIRDNLKLPAFEKAWLEIKSNSTSFQELRELEKDFSRDPATWPKVTQM